MTQNKISKQCPFCDAKEADCLGVVITKEEEGKVSYTHYKCINGFNPKKAHNFLVRRKGNLEEQNITQKFIDASKIKLD